MSDTGRVWEQGMNGLWSSRLPDDDDKKRAELFERWRRKEITYKELLYELEKDGENL